MNNRDLSYKLKFILHELGMNKKEFLEECHKYNPTLSKPTLLNAINNKNKTTPTVETLMAIIKVCQASNHKKLKNVSFDFLLNDQIQEITAENIAIYQSVGLSDEVIERLKQYNHPFYYDYGSIINYYFIHMPINYWRYVEMLKVTSDIQVSVSKIKDYDDLKNMLKHFDDDYFISYLERNFKNIYLLYKDLKNQKSITKNVKDKIEDLGVAVANLNKSLRYTIIDLDNKFFDNMML